MGPSRPKTSPRWLSRETLSTHLAGLEHILQALRDEAFHQF